MLAYIEGRLLERTENSCVLVTPGGVGELCVSGTAVGWRFLPRC